jgi:hypothetical protein
MFALSSRTLLAALVLGSLLHNAPAGATTEVAVPVLEIGKGASLSSGGAAVTVSVGVQCSSRWEVLEAFVYVTQNSAQSANAAIPVECGMDRPRQYNVQVSAGTAPFEQGEATATAYVLLQDADSGATTALNDTATILIRQVVQRSTPGER